MSNDAPRPEHTDDTPASESPKRKRRLEVESLEPRILLSATWADADTGDDLEGPTSGADVFQGADADDITVIGLDRAEKAVAFAETVGLLDEGLALDLEAEPLSDPVKENLTRIDLVTSTGCVGYVTEKSFEHLLPAVTQGRPAWIANFVLRMFPFDTIAETLGRWGYATEKLEGRTFVQRRFASTDEQGQVLDRLRERGVDPAGKEAEGHLVAEFYLSRPTRDAAEVSIERLLS